MYSRFLCVVSFLAPAQLCNVNLVNCLHYNGQTTTLVCDIIEDFSNGQPLTQIRLANLRATLFRLGYLLIDLRDAIEIAPRNAA